MKFLKITTIILGLCLSQAAQSSRIIVTQEWDERSVLSNGETARTEAVFSDTGITGTGVESVLVDYFGMNLIKYGIGQNFSLADFSDPPTRSEEGNMLAIFSDGVFSYLLNVSLGGAARITMRDSISGVAFYSINIGPGKIDFHLDPSGERDYFLQTTQIDIIPPVPVPGALLLFASGLFGLGFLHRFSASTGVRVV